MLGLRSTMFKVKDVTKPKEWYSKAFKTQAYFDKPLYVGFNIQGFELGLQSYSSLKGDDVLSCWGVENIAVNYNHLVQLGETEHEKITPLGCELMVSSVKDPWRNIIGLIYNPYFKLRVSNE